MVAADILKILGNGLELIFIMQCYKVNCPLFHTHSINQWMYTSSAIVKRWETQRAFVLSNILHAKCSCSSSCYSTWLFILLTVLEPKLRWLFLSSLVSAHITAYKNDETVIISVFSHWYKTFFANNKKYMRIYCDQNIIQRLNGSHVRSEGNEDCGRIHSTPKCKGCPHTWYDYIIG